MKSALILLLLFSNITIGQKIFSTKKGNIAFEASIPGFEEVKAKSDEATCKLNIENGTFESSLLVKSLHSKLELMEEHFNENYVESTKYPTSIFKGKIQETIDFSKDGENKVTVKGTLDLHGVTKEIEATGTLTVKGQELIIASAFKIKIADYNIKVPSLYVQNIAELVDVKVNATLEPFVKK